MAPSIYLVMRLVAGYFHYVVDILDVGLKPVASIIRKYIYLLNGNVNIYIDKLDSVDRS